MKLSRFIQNAARIVGLCAVVGAAFLTTSEKDKANAFPPFAKKEGKNCTYCHLAQGGARGFRGMYYKAHGLSFAEFDNVYEAQLAGVKDPEAEGAETKPTVPYPPKEKPIVGHALRFTAKDIDGKPVNLARYQGKVVMIVNVASKCGNTPQYTDLEKLYEKYKDKGLVILGFPANDFGMQEPGTDKEIKEFCSETYKVKFPMFSKVTVKGEKADPLYKFLTDKEKNEKFAGPIEWNFAKFIVNRNGEVVERVKATTNPSSKDVVATLEKLLKEKPEGAKEDADTKKE